MITFIRNILLLLGFILLGVYCLPKNHPESISNQIQKAFFELKHGVKNEKHY